MKDCTTCKYGYEDERLGIPMCHHPKRFSEDCVDFNMHEEKEVKGSEKSINGLDVTDFCKPIDPGIAQCIADHSWEMLGEDEKPVPADLEEAAQHSEILTYPMPEDGDIEKVFKVQEARVLHEIGFIAGAKWQAGQMMKEAVETRVIGLGLGDTPHIVLGFSDEFKKGDKVRVFICKKED